MRWKNLPESKNVDWSRIEKAQKDFIRNYVHDQNAHLIPYHPDDLPFGFLPMQRGEMLGPAANGFTDPDTQSVIEMLYRDLLSRTKKRKK